MLDSNANNRKSVRDPKTGRVLQKGPGNYRQSVNTLVAPVEASLDVVRDVHDELQAVSDSSKQSAAVLESGKYCLPYRSRTEAIAALYALRLFLEDGQEITLAEPASGDTSHEAIMHIPEAEGIMLREKLNKIDERIAEIRAMHVQNKASAITRYKLVEKELQRSGLVSPISEESLERLRQAYQLSVATHQLSDDDFIQRLESIADDATTGVMTQSQGEAMFVSVAMTVMNEIFEAQGKELPPREQMETQEGFSNRIAKVPERFAEMVGLAIIRQNDSRYLTRLRGEAWVDDNPVIPEESRRPTTLAARYGHRGAGNVPVK